VIEALRELAWPIMFLCGSLFGWSVRGTIEARRESDRAWRRYVAARDDVDRALDEAP
jgi:hypothetical protein